MVSEKGSEKIANLYFLNHCEMYLDSWLAIQINVPREEQCGGSNEI